MNTTHKTSENNFEKLIQQEVGDDFVSELNIDADETSEKISEVVGEKKEQKGSGLATKSPKKFGIFPLTSTKKIAFTLSNLPLPTPEKQKKELQRVIENNIKDLVKEATKIQNAKNYSPAHLEAIIQEIRNLRKILVELFTATIERIEELYRKFTQKEKN